MTSIVIDGVSRAFGEVHAARDISLEIHDGAIIANGNLMGLTPLTLWLACLLVVRNQRILTAWDARQQDDARRAAAGLPPRTRRRRRKTLASLAATTAPP